MSVVWEASARRIEVPANWELRPHRHRSLEMTLIAEGEGIVYGLNGPSIGIRKGTILLIPSNREHGCKAKSPLKMLVLTIKDERGGMGLEEEALQTFGKKSFFCRTFSPAVEAEYVRIFRKLMREASSEQPYKTFAMRLYTEHLLLLIMRSDQAAEPPTELNETMLKAAREMELHYESEFRVKEFANRFHLSESYFRSKFKEVIGVQPKQFLLDARLRVAEHLLLSSDASVAWVARESGFSSVHHFNQLFFKKHGVKPASWRVGSKL